MLNPARGAQNYKKIVCLIRNNILNKVHVAEPELQQLLP